MFGLREEEIRTIREILAKYDTIEEAVIYGKRAREEGCTCAGKVEIALKGEKVTVAEAKDVSYDLNEETLMKYCFHVVNYNGLKNNQLIDEINKEGVILYQKK